MVIRTYFDKANTIVKNSEINTGKNPIAELYYGTNSNGRNEYSKFIFHFDLENITKHFGAEDIGNMEHWIKMTNTGRFHNDLLNKTTGDGKVRTTSFDLILFELPTEWTGGIGYDLDISDDSINSKAPSNWFYAKTGRPWTLPISPDPTSFHDVEVIEIARQSFADGNENLEMEITSLVNDYITGGKTNYGLCISFESDIETLDTDGLQYAGFFTPHTQTFYQPFVESRHIQPISDDRAAFYMDTDSKLYLYANQKGFPVDIAGEVLVDIKDGDGNFVFTDLPTTRERKGVYSVTVNVRQDESLVGHVYYDVWKTSTKQLVEMQVELLDNNDFTQFSSFDTEPKDFRIDIRGIKHNEQIGNEDIRKVYVNAIIPYTVKEKSLIDNIEYRLYVLEGENEHTVIDYTMVDKTYSDNFFLLDTSSLLPNRYFLDIRVESNLEVKTTHGIISFEVIK